MIYDPQWEKIVEQELSCGVCYNVYQYPIYLGCKANHTICLECLRKIEYQVFKIRSKCPLCRESIKLLELFEKYEANINVPIQSAINNSKVLCVPFKTEDPEENKSKQIQMTSTQIKELQRYMQPRCQWSGFKKDFDQHFLQKCSNTFHVCDKCTQLHAAQGQCPKNLEYNRQMAFYKFSIDYEGANNLDKIKIERKIEESKDSQQHHLILRQPSCPFNKLICRTIYDSQIICKNDHLGKQCPFEIKLCQDCTMIFFLFNFKGHIKSGYCQKVKNLWDGLDMQKFIPSGFLEIKNSNEFIKSQIKSLTDKINLLPAQLEADNINLNFLNLEPQVMFQLGVLFQAGKFGYPSKQFGSVKLRGVNQDENQLFVKGEFQKGWSFIKYKILDSTMDKNITMNLLAEKKKRNQEGDVYIIKFLTSPEVINTAQSLSMNQNLVTRIYDTDLRQL